MGNFIQLVFGLVALAFQAACVAALLFVVYAVMSGNNQWIKDAIEATWAALPDWATDLLARLP